MLGRLASRVIDYPDRSPEATPRHPASTKVSTCRTRRPASGSPGIELASCGPPEVGQSPCVPRSPWHPPVGRHRPFSPFLDTSWQTGCVRSYSTIVFFEYVYTQVLGREFLCNLMVQIHQCWACRGCLFRWRLSRYRRRFVVLGVSGWVFGRRVGVGAFETGGLVSDFDTDDSFDGVAGGV